MACYHPLVAFQTDSGDVVFSERGKIRRELTLPCGNCVGCRLERSRQWAMRCLHESQMHDSNYFVTLTYDDDHVPDDYSLRYRDFQLFMKRLRKQSGKPIRFYMCGEYGSRLSRPHYHACLFGLELDDLYLWRTSGTGFKLYRSPKLESIWQLGSCEIGYVTFESAAYIARYCVKAITHPGNEWILDPDTGELYERPREFTRMSLKPGIGATWYEKYKKEVFPLDRVVVRGKEMKPPRYYRELLKQEAGTVSDDVEYKRYLESLESRKDSTRERLEVKEVVAKAGLNKLKRSLE